MDEVEVDVGDVGGMWERAVGAFLIPHTRQTLSMTSKHIRRESTLLYESNKP